MVPAGSFGGADAVCACVCARVTLQLWREEIDKPCGDFAVSWFTGNILSFLAAMVVAGTNGALQLVLRWVVKAERHVSQSAELAAFSAKLLLAQYVCMLFNGCRVL